MGLVQARVELPSTTGLPEDIFVNTFNFRWDGPTAPSVGELGDLAAAIESFYNLDTVAGGAIAARMSHEISRVSLATVTKIYTADDLGDPLGSPSLTDAWTLGAGTAGATSLPGEVALVASIYADTTDIPQEVGVTRPAARRRGRVYVGPLNTSALGEGAGETDVQRPLGVFMNEVVEVVKRLGEASKNIMNLNAGLFLSVYSPTDVAVRNAIHVHVDNAFDTQRKRGSAATFRVTDTIDQS